MTKDASESPPFAVATPIPATASTNPPALDILLKPHVFNEVVDYVDGRLRIEEPGVAAGSTLVRLPLTIVSIPTARYDGRTLQAHDAKGDLPLTQEEEPPTPSGVYRRWLPTRTIAGDVILRFRALPRVVSAQTRTGPLFDLRAEAGGVQGAGISFLPLPDTKTPYRVHLQWDLSEMPRGSRGVWSLGEGEVRTTATAESLAFSYYAAGPVKRYPADPSSAFAMYWLSPPAFDLAAVADRIQSLYATMSEFFREESSSYRVFIRKNPHKAGGGTALLQSFVFGWSDASVPTADNLQSLLAHEMAHNWPKMEGDEWATAWYTEGTAEYYSILLSYRSGALTSEQFLEMINDQASAYYTNPLRTLSNDEAAQQFWSDWSAQRIPYSRGFMYLAKVDAKIRAKTRGKRSLDDIVRSLIERKRNHQPHGINVWLDLVTRELGPIAKRDYEAMVRGTMLIPPPNTFAPCFRPERYRERRFELGFDASSLHEGRRAIHGLIAGSEAARAGLRDGDEVIESTELEAQKSPMALLTMRVRRAGEELTIEYLPRGPPSASYRWVRIPGVPDSSCRGH